MLSLPHGRTLLIVGWILVVCIVVGSLLPAVPRLDVSEGDKVLHFLGYFGITLWFAGLYPRRQLWIIALGAFTLGALLEVAQGTLTAHRQMDLADLAVNTAGIFSACILALLGMSRWALRLENWLTKGTFPRSELP
jgi:VanZ family protein